MKILIYLLLAFLSINLVAILRSDSLLNNRHLILSEQLNNVKRVHLEENFFIFQGEFETRYPKLGAIEVSRMYIEAQTIKSLKIEVISKTQDQIVRNSSLAGELLYNPLNKHAIGFDPITDSSKNKYSFTLKYDLNLPVESIEAIPPIISAKYQLDFPTLLRSPSLVIKMIVNKWTNLFIHSKIDVFILIFIFFFLCLQIIFSSLQLTGKSDNQQLLKKIKKHFVSDWVWIFVITLIVSSYFSILEIDPHHDGIMLKPALDLAGGAALFRESFTQYGALTTYLQTLALMVFGKQLWVIKILTAFFYSGTAVVLLIIWKTIFGRRNAIIAWALWMMMASYLLHIFLAWSSVYALFSQLFSSLLIIRYITEESEKKRFYLIFLTGFIGASTFWFKQSIGAFHMVSLTLSLFLIIIYNKDKFWVKKLATFIGGICTISAVILGWIIVTGSLNDWWTQSIIFALNWRELHGGNITFLVLLRNLLPASIGPISVWAALPIGTILVWIKSLQMFVSSRNSKNRHLQMLIFMTISLASWLQYYPISDIRHTYWAATPMFGNLIYLLWLFSEPFHNRGSRWQLIRNSIFFISIISIFYFDIQNRISTGLLRSRADYIDITYPAVFSNMRDKPKKVLEYKLLADEIRDFQEKYPRKPIITNGFDALYLVIGKNQKNFHPFYVDWGKINDLTYPDYRQSFSNFISQNKPLIISPSAALPAGYCQPKSISNNIFLLFPCDVIESKNNK